MKHAFDRFVQYLQKNYFSYWIVLGIDTFIALICTFVWSKRTALCGLFSRMSAAALRTLTVSTAKLLEIIAPSKLKA